MDAIFQNTGAMTQTVLLTFKLAGGTAVRVARAVLKSDQQLVVCGLAIQPDDTLRGETTGAGAVDYLIQASLAETLSIRVLEETGAPLQSADVTLSVSERSTLTIDGIVLSGLLEEIRDAILRI